MDNKKTEKKLQKYYCNHCDFSCSQKNDWERHILRPKHLNNVENDKKDNNKTEKNLNIFICIQCSKNFKFQSGLSRHKKICNINKNYDSNKIYMNYDNENDNTIVKQKDEIIMKLLKDNEELMKIIKDMLPKIGNTNINTTNNNNHFNLQFFLNEQCKDAININEFVDSLKITIDDLNYTKDNGLIKGITDVMIRGLKELDIYKRPIHCTDAKRETLYIKDENKWEKDEHNEKMKETIITIANKERDAINEWKEEYPLWNEDEDKQDEFMLLVNKVYRPIEERENYENKILKALSKEVFIDK